MKTKLPLTIFLFIGLHVAVNAQRVIDNPFVENQLNEQIYFKIERVTINENNTTIDFRAIPYVNGNMWLPDPPNSSIWNIVAGGKTYKQISNTFPGKTEANSVKVEKNKSILFSVTFEAIPFTTNKFDIVDEGIFSLYGIDLNKQNHPIVENWGEIGSEEAHLKIEKDINSGNIFFTDNDDKKWTFVKIGDVYQARENKTTYTLTYLDKKTIEIKSITTSDSYIVLPKTETYKIVKDVREHLNDAAQTMKTYGLVFRYTLNYGKIGENFVPLAFDSNADKIFRIGGKIIREKDMHNYLNDSDYSGDTKGYTYVYQIINPGNRIYKIRYNISGTGKFPNIEKTPFWNASETDTLTDDKNFNLDNLIILNPNETFKDQVKIGTYKPIDMEFNIESMEEISADWLKKLKIALTSNDVSLINKYLSDPKAKDWYAKLTTQKESIVSTNQAKFSSQTIQSIKTSIAPSSDLLFDKDFDSEVTYTLKNTISKDLKVTYSVCGKPSEEVIVHGGDTYQKTITVKGIPKESLSIKVTKVELN